MADRDQEKGVNGVYQRNSTNGYLEVDSPELSDRENTPTSTSTAHKTVHLTPTTPFLQNLRSWIRTAGAEEGGIERIPEEARTNQTPFSLFAIFMSSNICVATLAFGTLGPAIFGLGWWDSFYCCLIFNIIGSIPPALTATLGPKLGLRTMVLPRYSFGWYPAKVIAFIALLNQIGWAMVNAIAGAVILYDVGNGKLPLAVSVLLICIFSLLIGSFGYRQVHQFERYSWAIVALCFIVVAGFGAKHMINVPMATGGSETSGVLSFGTTIIGFQISWSAIAADYGVYIRSDRKPASVFWWTFFGNFISQFFVELLGIGLMTMVQANGGTNPFADAYARAGVGGLTGQIFQGYNSHVVGFGKFIQVLLSFSVVGVVVVNIYSIGLNVQAMGMGLLKVPRLVWSLLAGIIFLAAAVVGRDHLSSVMENFLNVIAYWLTPFLTILFLEHIIWRRGYAYDVTAWDDKTRLPHGYAASFSFIVGAVLAILCMSQKWWVGPIALRVGSPPFGTDISWELALGVTVCLYVPLRYLERRKFGL